MGFRYLNGLATRETLDAFLGLAGIQSDAALPETAGPAAR